MLSAIGVVTAVGCVLVVVVVIVVPVSTAPPLVRSALLHSSLAVSRARSLQPSFGHTCAAAQPCPVVYQSFTDRVQRTAPQSPTRHARGPTLEWRSFRCVRLDPAACRVIHCVIHCVIQCVRQVPAPRRVEPARAAEGLECRGVPLPRRRGAPIRRPNTTRAPRSQSKRSAALGSRALR